MVERHPEHVFEPHGLLPRHVPHRRLAGRESGTGGRGPHDRADPRAERAPLPRPPEARVRAARSEERRVGEESRSRWAPGHLKKKKQIQQLAIQITQINQDNQALQRMDPSAAMKNDDYIQSVLLITVVLQFSGSRWRHAMITM